MTISSLSATSSTAAAMYASTEIVWQADADRLNAANDQLRITYSGGGYETGDPDAAAACAIQAATTWLRLLEEG